MRDRRRKRRRRSPSHLKSVAVCPSASKASSRAAPRARFPRPPRSRRSLPRSRSLSPSLPWRTLLLRRLPLLPPPRRLSPKSPNLKSLRLRRPPPPLSSPPLHRRNVCSLYLYTMMTVTNALLMSFFPFSSDRISKVTQDLYGYPLPAHLLFALVTSLFPTL